MINPELVYIPTRECLRQTANYERRFQSKQPIRQPINEEDNISGIQIVVGSIEPFSYVQPQLDSSDFYLFIVNSQKGSGKFTAARELSYKAHSIGYKLLNSSGCDIIDAPKRSLQDVKGAKKVYIVLDDIPYVLSATSPKTQNKTKNFFGLIRHAPEIAQVLLIVICHFTTALPPRFKNANLLIFSKPVVEFNRKNKEQLDRVFQSIVGIQTAPLKPRNIPLYIYCRSYLFHWGSGKDKVYSRLMLLIMGGQALVYRSTNNYYDQHQQSIDEDDHSYGTRVGVIG